MDIDILNELKTGDREFRLHERRLRRTLEIIGRFREADRWAKKELGYVIEKTKFANAGLSCEEYRKRCLEAADKWGI